MKFRYLLSFALVGLLSLVATIPRARAQSYGNQAIVPGGTNSVPLQSTNTYGSNGTNFLIDVTRRNNLGFFLSFSANNATNLSNVTFVFSQSLSGVTNFMTTNLTRISLPAFGTNVVTYMTNYQTGGVGWWQLTSIENLNGTALSNLVVEYSQKPPPY